MGQVIHECEELARLELNGNHLGRTGVHYIMREVELSCHLLPDRPDQSFVYCRFFCIDPWFMFPILAIDRKIKMLGSNSFHFEIADRGEWCSGYAVKLFSFIHVFF